MRGIDNFINTLSNKIERKHADLETIDSVYKKVEQLTKTERPNPEDFKNIVPFEKIRSDIETTQKLEERWKQETSPGLVEVKKLSDITEYLIYKNFAHWVDFKALPLLTAKSDDYLRGVDLVIESDKEPTVENPDIEHLGIGIDVALLNGNHYSSTLESKKAKMRRMLESGSLTEARYVAGKHFEGSITELPYLIVCVHSAHIKDLLESIGQKYPTEKEKNHIIKYIVAYQLIRQLGTYYQVSNAKNLKQAAYHYAVGNNFATDIFQELINHLQNDAELWGRVSKDPGVIEIEQFCDRLEKDLT